MSKLKKHWLQFFADGGSAATGDGDGAEQGVDAVDPGQQDELEQLGIPKAKAERFRETRSKRMAEKAADEKQSVEGSSGQQTATMTWDEFMSIPENNQRMQKTMSDRLKRQAKDHDSFMNELSPALQMLSQKYGLEVVDGKIDAKALAAAITDDDSLYEDKALELGIDTESAKKIAHAEYVEKQQREQQARADREEQLRNHFYSMQKEADDVTKIYPSFDLQRELQNQRFFQMTSPEGGMSVMEAVMALHGTEILDQHATSLTKSVKQDISNAVRAGRAHPRENGSNTSAAVSTPNLQNMSREERTAYIKRMFPPK